MKKNKKEYWKERGFETKEEWCKSRRDKYFETKSKICFVCGLKFYKNRNCCSNKCNIIKNTKINENGCWIWQLSKDPMGYGNARNYETKKLELIHRQSYRIFKGEIPFGKFVCHSCDVRACCNPDHLWIGTQKDNIKDAANKGKMSHPGLQAGEKSGRSKLKEFEVLEIKKLLRNKIKCSELAKKFKVALTTIYSIKQKQNWKYINDVLL